jgi:hypothetical protein
MLRRSVKVRPPRPSIPASTGEQRMPAGEGGKTGIGNRESEPFRTLGVLQAHQKTVVTEDRPHGRERPRHQDFEQFD